MTQYKSFLHVERLDKSECDGLLAGPCVVTAKLDGTNAVVYWNDEEGICAGSRKRALTEEKDNAGFCNWLRHSNNEEAQLLSAFMSRYKNRYIIFGEWMGSNKFIGSIKTYNKEALGQMYIFDVFDTEELRYLSDPEWRGLLSAPFDLSPWFVHSFGIYEGLTMEKIQEIAENNHFLLPTDKVGEGVVVKRIDNWKNAWGNIAYGKLVLEEFKQEKAKPKVKDDSPQEEFIVRDYVTNSEIAKSVAKVCVLMDIDEFDYRNGQCMGRLMNLCYQDLLEECPNWVKQFKNPTVDFMRLKKCCDAAVRTYLGL